MPKNLLPVIALIGMACLGYGIYSLQHKQPELNYADTSVPQVSKPQPKTSSNDLRDTYGRAGEHIYNKKTMTFMYTAEEFFRDSGKQSFDGLIFDQVSHLPPGLKWVGGKPLTPDDYRMLEAKARR